MIKVDVDGLILWKPLLLAYVEGCRPWNEYRAVGGRASVSVVKGIQVLCTCGNGVFPEQFKVDVPMWDRVTKYYVRAAVPPLFHCPLIDGVLDFGEQDRNNAGVVHACCVCHKRKAEGGGDLETCGQCRSAKYYSAQFQCEDWKKHKATCVTDGKWM